MANTRDITAVLVGARHYDSLTSEEQAIVRAEGARRMAARRNSLDLAEEFSVAGESYTELGEHGDVVRRVPPTFAG